MPLQSAIYCALTGKIYGMMGPYIVQFNATTGAKENIARVAAPMFGPCAICYHAATFKLYVATYLDQAWVDNTSSRVSDQVDIFPVDPVTLAVGSPLLIQDAIATFAGYSYQEPGPIAIMSSGNYLYFGYQYRGLWTDWARIDPSNTIDNAVGTIGSWPGGGWFSLQADLGVVSAVPSIIIPHPGSNIAWGPIAFTGLGNQLALSTDAESPVALVQVGSITWAVCGNRVMIRADLGAATFQSGDPTDLGNYNAAYNLENGAAITGAIPGVRPFHVRYSSTNGTLLIPCQNKDCVIVYDVGTNTGILKTGFDGPVDVVLTPSKAFAVQSGPVGLKEIV